MSDNQIVRYFGPTLGTEFNNDAAIRKYQMTQHQFHNWDELTFEQALTSTAPVKVGFRF